MYIIKNALRNISRSKGRNILIGIIILVIVIAATVSLSIRQAADQAKEDGLAELNITANITIDREQMMENSGGSDGAVDQDSFRDQMDNASSLSLEDLQKYAKAKSVKDFYYTVSSSVNASSIEPVESNVPTGGRGGMQETSSSDFTLVGYSSDAAMTSFTDGTSEITDGAMFDENTKEAVCIISEELAEYNSLEVGDSITVVSPDSTSKKTTLKISGIYSTTAATSSTGAGGGQGSMGIQDSTNQIITSYEEATTVNTALAVDGSTQGTYTFASVSDYEKFEDQAHDLGLGDEYTVESSDINQFEQSLAPLENLSKYALWFLIIVLVIGIIILVVMNIFSVRERKYEVGVLSAMGMRKSKVALQFITETLAITIVAIIIGTSIGAATSVPITNALLSSSSATSSSDSFDRGGGGGGRGGDMGQAPEEQSDSSSDTSTTTDTTNSDSTTATTSNGDAQQGDPPSDKGGFGNYIDSVSSATDFGVVMQVLGIGLLLSIIASGVAINYIMRFDPLRILSNRD